MTRVLIAEDDPQALRSLAALLEDEGFAVTSAPDGLQASAALAAQRFDIALLDVRMPGKDGLTLLREIQDRPQPPPVLVMTAYGTSSIAIEAMKLGAYDYLVKPLHFDELLIQIQRAMESRRRSDRLEILEREQAGGEEPEIVGQSAAMQNVYKQIGQVAPTDSTVLIRGESGVGKELVARAIHAHSPRSSHRMVAVNCAALPENLLEAELFGAEKGAYTGSAGRRRGRFELANGGTIFLDEIGELAPATQAKLLRAVQERTIERLGGEQSLELDIRILAATNRDLEAGVRDGSFREDLYYRLNVFSITIPPLRERREDIPELAQRLLRKIARDRGVPTGGFAPGAIEAIERRHWPGNVRELEHALERALIVSRGGPLPADAFAADAEAAPADPFAALPLEEGLQGWTAKLERSLVERALRQAEGNRTRAAELLGIHRRLLYSKLDQFELK